MPSTTKSKKQNRIDALLTKINAPCKSEKCVAAGVCEHEGEKEAARSIYLRIMDNAGRHRESPRSETTGQPLYAESEYAQMWAKVYERGYDEYGNSWHTGSKHHLVEGIEYAKPIRAEIRLARKLARTPLITGDDPSAPASQRLALYHFDPIGQAPDDVKIKVHTRRGGYTSGVEIVVEAPIGWGWTGEDATDSSGRPFTAYSPTDALKELGRELRRLGAAYNASHGSNLSTGCFADSFTLSVYAVNPRGGWYTGIA